MTTSSTLVRSARVRAGLTQVQLAERLGVSQAAVARLEDPTTNPTLATLDDAMRATGHRLRLSMEPSAPSIDESLIVRKLEMTPRERVAEFEQSYGGARELALAARRSRGDLA